MGNGEKEVAHVIACARALCYGENGLTYILKDLLQAAVRDLDAFAVEIEDLEQIGREDEVPIPEHACHEQAIDLGTSKSWCRICGSLRQGLQDGAWVAPQSANPGFKETR